MVKIVVKPMELKKPDDPLESKIESTVIRYARSKGFYARKFTSPSNRSVPDDLLLNLRGEVFFIEFKRLGKMPTHAQQHEHDLITSNGGTVHVIDNIKDGKELIDGYC